MFLALKMKTLFDFSLLNRLWKNKGYIRMKKISSHKFISGTLLVFILGLAACENPNQTNNASKTYFDLRGFMQTQITYLKKNNPKVKKTILNEGKPMTKDVTIKDWEKELRMFVNADINKAALIGTYTTKKNGNSVTYTSKESKNTVQSMTVALDDSKKQAKSIVIVAGNENLLFSSGTQLKLYCKKAVNDQYSIAGYEIKGFQKIIMREKRPYEIKVTVL
ncbi:hypothetical protein BKI52_11290 [marine bacterium AO1-C]|nr:hypothetical protein BKI52_11290 [marine bacterium AO1-C]